MWACVSVQACLVYSGTSDSCKRLILMMPQLTRRSGSICLGETRKVEWVLTGCFLLGQDVSAAKQLKYVGFLYFMPSIGCISAIAADSLLLLTLIWVTQLTTECCHCALQMEENEELRRAHDKRRERLRLIQTNYKAVRDQLKEMEKSNGMWVHTLLFNIS